MQFTQKKSSACKAGQWYITWTMLDAECFSCPHNSRLPLYSIYNIIYIYRYIVDLKKHVLSENFHDFYEYRREFCAYSHLKLNVCKRKFPIWTFCWHSNNFNSQFIKSVAVLRVFLLSQKLENATTTFCITITQKPSFCQDELTNSWSLKNS